MKLHHTPTNPKIDLQTPHPKITKLKLQNQKKLMQACHQFESLLINSMLSSMRKTLKPPQQKSSFFSNQSHNIFDDMLYQQYSLQISKKSNLGLAHSIYQQIQKSY